MNPITAAIIGSALTYAGEEMGLAIRNAAYSPNIKERLDHSCALFDASGNLIAQAEQPLPRWSVMSFFFLTRLAR